MLKRKCALLLMLGWGTVLSIHAEGTPQELFQKGLSIETSDRDVEKAADVYRQVISAAKDDLSLLARAEFRLGTCQEKLGRKKEAREAYQKVFILTSQAPADVARSAEENLTRLESEMDSAPAQSTVAVEAEPSWRRGWISSLEIGMVHQAAPRVIGFNDRQGAAWLSLGYRRTKRALVGLEGAYFPDSVSGNSVRMEFSPEPAPIRRVDTFKTTAAYVGPFAKAIFDGRSLTMDLSIGAGAVYWNYDGHVNRTNSVWVSYSPYILTSYDRWDVHDSGWSPAISLSAGLKLKIGSQASVGFSVRELTVGTRKVYNPNFDSESGFQDSRSMRFRQIWLPAVGVQVGF